MSNQIIIFMKIYYMHVLCVLLLNTQVQAGNETVSRLLLSDPVAVSANNMEIASIKHNYAFRDDVKTKLACVDHNQEILRLYFWYDKYIYTLRLTGSAALAIALPTYEQWPPLHTMPRATPPRRAGGFFVAFSCIGASIIAHWARTKTMLTLSKESQSLELKAQMSEKKYKNALVHYKNRVEEYNHLQILAKPALETTPPSKQSNSKRGWF